MGTELDKKIHRQVWSQVDSKVDYGQRHLENDIKKLVSTPVYHLVNDQVYDPIWRIMSQIYFNINQAKDFLK